MLLTSPHFRQQRFPTRKHLDAAFRIVQAAEADPFLVLQDISDFCCGFIQALREIKPGETYRVEFKDYATERLYRMDYIGLEQGVALFEEFQQLGPRILANHPWHDVTQQVLGEGCGEDDHEGGVDAGDRHH